MNVYEILEEVKLHIKPDFKKLKEVDLFIEKINRLLKKAKIKAVCVPGGSYAKGTFLKNDFDVDLFVRFDYSYADEDISQLLGSVLMPFKPVIVHGSRDYYQLKNAFTYEIIPVLNVTDYTKVKNVTDMSPLHVDYVKSQLDRKPTLAEEIRLAKQFCKSQGCYGAESYIAGFSGHVLDILIIHYGSLLTLLSAAANDWKKKKIIDPGLHLDNPEKELNKAKTDSPLILVDPIQPDRNAAAALSEEKYAGFKKAAKAFLDNPSQSFFVIRTIDEAYLKEVKAQYGESVLVRVNIIPAEGKPDVAGAKAHKVYEFLKKEITEKGFVTYASGWQFLPSTILYYIVKKEELSELEERMGPPTRSKRHYKEFITKHAENELFIKNSRVHAYVKRKHTTIKGLISALLDSSYVKERVEKIQSVRFL
ncbi:MAG: nucleotidyltransferase domain-containing protein [Nanoarchaeota archaeon]